MNTRISKNKILVILSIPLVLLVMCIGTSIGSSNINLFDVFNIIAHKLFSVPLQVGIESKDVAIIWHLRLPRVILAFFVGASLGVGILIATGISIPLLGNLTLPIVGFIFSLFTMFLVLSFATKVDKHLSNTTIILVGMVISLFFNAVLTIITALLTEKMQNMTMWSMGSFSMRGWSYVLSGLPFFIFAYFRIAFYFKEMDLLVFGEDQAKSIGVDTNKVKKKLFLYVAILTGTSVGLSGTIGFIDLIAPHLVRKIFGSRHKLVVPMSIVLGGCMMIIADLIARTIISPSELPVGAITALIGGPFFGYIYFKKGK